MIFDSEGASIGEADMMGLAERESVKLAQSFWTTVFWVHEATTVTKPVRNSRLSITMVGKDATHLTYRNVMHERFLLLASQQRDQIGRQLDHLLGI